MKTTARRGKLQLAILECLEKPVGESEGMMTTLELLADERLAPFWFLRGRVYVALADLIDDGLVFIAQRDLITPERGFRPRNYYALVSRTGSK